MPRCLLVCSTVDGQTLKILRRITHALEAAGHTVALQQMEDAGGTDPAAYDAVLIGASIRYGKHRPDVAAFVERHRTALASRPSGFFSVNVVARKPGKNTPEGNPYVRKFLATTGWTPTLPGVFAGRIDYPALRPMDRQIIRFIMWITKGPTDPTAVVEFTDWSAVDAYAQRFAALLPAARARA